MLMQQNIVVLQFPIAKKTSHMKTRQVTLKKRAFSLARRRLISRLVPAVCCGILKLYQNIFGLARELIATFTANVIICGYMRWDHFCCVQLKSVSHVQRLAVCSHQNFCSVACQFPHRSGRAVWMCLGNLLL